MEAIILSKSDLDAIKTSLEEMKGYLKNITSPAEHFINNDEFIKLMGISTRTAQVWRLEGKIGYSQEGKGKKIYYRMSDVEKFLAKHYKAPADELIKTSK